MQANEVGPGGKWVVVKDIKADPGGTMAVVESESYRSPCQEHNPGVPVYTRAELSLVKKATHSAELFRGTQKIKKAFPGSRVVSVDSEHK